MMSRSKTNTAPASKLETVQALIHRVEALEAVQHELAGALARCRASVATLELDHVATAIQVDEAARQSAKAVTSVLDRLDRLRGA